MAATLWIGGAFALLVVRQSSSGESGVSATLNRAYRELTDVAVPVFLLTGAILTFEQFSNGVPGAAYVAALSAKIVLAFGMFHVGFRLRRPSRTGSGTNLPMLCAAGAMVVFLATVLKALSTGAPT